MIRAEAAVECPLGLRSVVRGIRPRVAHHVSVADGDARVDGAVVGAVGNKKTHDTLIEQGCICFALAVEDPPSDNAGGH